MFVSALSAQEHPPTLPLRASPPLTLFCGIGKGCAAVCRGQSQLSVTLADFMCFYLLLSQRENLRPLSYEKLLHDCRAT